MLRCLPRPWHHPRRAAWTVECGFRDASWRSAAIRVVRDIAEHDLQVIVPASTDTPTAYPDDPRAVIRSAPTINATRSRTVQVLHPRYHVGRPLRGEYLASSASRQAPLLAPAAALACSHLSRASSPGLRSARLYQRRPAVARATAPVARPANPSALPAAISTAATASSSRGRSCRDGSVRRDEVTMTCSHDSLSSDTAPDTPATHASVKSMTGHPPGRVTVSVCMPIVVAGTVGRRAGRPALDQAWPYRSAWPYPAQTGAGYHRSGPTILRRDLPCDTTHPTGRRKDRLPQEFKHGRPLGSTRNG